MTYERLTATAGREVLRLAQQILTERIPTQRIGGDSHSVTLSGGDGTVTFHVHGHGLETLVRAETDQVRTSRLDGEVQYVLTLLPYQPGERKGHSDVVPGGLARDLT